MLAIESRERGSLLSGFVHITTEKTEAPAEECGCSEVLCEKHNRDKSWMGGRRLILAWSLSTSEVVIGEMQPMSHKTKQAVIQDAILEHEHEKDPRWKVML
jgi:hypothetical protein